MTEETTPNPQFKVAIEVAIKVAIEALDDPDIKDGILSNSDMQSIWSELSGFGFRQARQMPRGTVDDRTFAMRRRLQKKVAVKANVKK